MKTVASEILHQLGGNRFIAMTGAKGFLDGGNYLAFLLPRKVKMVITLTECDLYRVTKYKIKNYDLVEQDARDGVWADQLQEVFTDMTGLYCTL